LKSWPDEDSSKTMLCESTEEDYCSSWSEPDEPGVCRFAEEYQLSHHPVLMGGRC